MRRAGNSTERLSRRSAASRLSLVVTESTVDTGFLQAMAIHTASHCDVAFTVELISRGDLAVAFRAGAARFQMRLVAEIYIAGDLVNARPGNLTFVLRECRQFLNRWTIRLHGCVAL